MPPPMGEALKTHLDIATGGIMTILGGKGITIRTNCTHSETVAIISAGIERIVCESCGNVSFMFLDDMAEEHDRLLDLVNEHSALHSA